MKTPSTSSTTTFILLFYLLFPFLHASCPSKCGNDNTVHGCRCNSMCSVESYWYRRQGIQKCERCTPKCSEDLNQIEVTSCTLDHNRVCHCKPGFYCTSKNNYSTYCNKPCVPCEPGTFSSKHSLNPTCMPHTDCASFGMIVIKEGTATQDRECRHPVTTPMTTTTPSTVITIISSTTDSTLSPSTTDSSATTTTPTTHTFITIKPITSPTLHYFRSQQNPSHLFAAQMRQLSLQSTAETTSPPSTDVNTRGDQLFINTSSVSQSYWLLLWIFLLTLLLVMTGICLLQKRTAQKTISKCTGVLYGKHSLKDHKVEAQLPLGNDIRAVRGQSMGVMSPKGGVQQVSNGKSENVSNTVGSIYIYSPGMVILGSNSGDKKEEAEVCEQNVPLISTPQQESAPPSQEIRVRMSTQEDIEEELNLSFPVPASGK
ncbi:tumor necrosis factor receptor superfamily member 21 [Myxocyprinus asiaticus]|uniref:tumor necrosis factor receptor superfamily member 21 n=1 Tax=Myxocyprinus asiaticus TaxID=70543 RepID=UPI002221BCAC|nr:tumor necrosis factor receptor superfamily member 21 [Myxocyprinus asiaticus]